MRRLSAKECIAKRAPYTARGAHGGRVVGSLGAGWFLVSIGTSLTPSVSGSTLLDAARRFNGICVRKCVSNFAAAREPSSGSVEPPFRTST